MIIVDSIRRQNNFNFAKSGLVRVGFGDAYNSDLGTLKENYQTRKVHFQKVEDARAYFIKVFNDYVKDLNADKRLAQLVKGHPFGPANTEIQITFLDEQGSPSSAPHIARIRNSQNTLIIYTYNPQEERYVQIAQEPLPQL
jgi:hypothetical protein